jgi:hypothetical protein
MKGLGRRFLKVYSSKKMTDMITIKNRGKVNRINKITDGIGMRVANKFLTNLVKKFAKQSTQYIQGTNEAPYSFGEKQIHSILAPAISQLSHLMLMESPINRKWDKRKRNSQEPYTGFLDYWVRYKKIDFFIEVKMDTDSYQSETTRKDLKQHWHNMIHNQLAPLKHEAKSSAEWSKGVVLSGLHIIPIREHAESSKGAENHEELLKIQKRYMKSLEPKPDWSALWIIPKSLVECSNDEYENKDKADFYPAVLFLAYIDEIISAE